jgi:hypothetical protein
MARVREGTRQRPAVSAGRVPWPIDARSRPQEDPPTLGNLGIPAAVSTPSPVLLGIGRHSREAAMVAAQFEKNLAGYESAMATVRLAGK